MMEDEGTAQDGEATPSPKRMTRLGLLQKGAVAGAAGVAAGSLIQITPAAAAPEAAPPTLQFLTQWEFDYLTAMAETIWPTDQLGPGAREAGVAYYIDGQLAGSWGQGHRFYLNGPFFAPADTGHGWQIPMTPADVYRAFLPGYDDYVRQTFGNPYTLLTADQQTAAMTALQTGKATVPIGGTTSFASSDFYSMFRQNVLEGMLADPSYGGNKNMVGWKQIGYPGDPMRRGDLYFQYIFSKKAYPYANKPLPLAPKYATRGVASGAAATGSKKPANASTNNTKGGM
ncbi:MAG: gluconate 2-dehydrogenase gamma chain [Gaiellaceae bacterium]|jgi:gluconate 2-dehydrogenase gamma chain|nr:gluconate 2-dehydrogenase gamma chain [Gaiellaceae bacterium]